ncbi:MAG: M23 family metallopeptidase [Spirochaetaceae bacterium]|jgi:murein DD-endopeptidase MepM/ murein hydrolase activator NlpD|nr:M23 family metallopeptidase [Spirochaetaceae bacterium]
MTGALVPVVFLVFCLSAVAQSNAELPLIKQLNPDDVLFKQYIADVEAGRKSVFSRYPAKTAEDLAQELNIYTYKPAQNDQLFLIAARCNIPYDSLVTLNRWESRDSISTSKLMLIPSIPGIFIPEKADSDLERLLVSRSGAEGVLITVYITPGEKENFRFIPGSSFTPNERFFFLNPGLFRFPLRSYHLTSPFGIRVSPISGRSTLHGGLDLAASQGSDVFAVSDGVVIETGASPVYGNYIIMSHKGNWTSLYGHLSAVEVRLRQNVKSGIIIGKVGNTGQSTGPHLHFELRQNGTPQDPAHLLRQQ